MNIQTDVQTNREMHAVYLMTYIYAECIKMSVKGQFLDHTLGPYNGTKNLIHRPFLLIQSI